MTSGCPFCGEVVGLMKTTRGFIFMCGRSHLFQFDGMDADVLSIEDLKQIIAQWERRDGQ